MAKQTDVGRHPPSSAPPPDTDHVIRHSTTFETFKCFRRGTDYLTTLYCQKAHKIELLIPHSSTRRPRREGRDKWAKVAGLVVDGQLSNFKWVRSPTSSNGAGQRMREPSGPSAAVRNVLDKIAKRPSE